MNTVIVCGLRVELRSWLYGVIKDHLANTTYKFDCLTPWSLYEKLDSWAGKANWGNYAFYTLLTLRKGANVDRFNAKIGDFIDKHAPSDTTGPIFFIYPLLKLHLYGEFINGLPSGGKIEQVRFFMALAFGDFDHRLHQFYESGYGKISEKSQGSGHKKKQNLKMKRSWVFGLIYSVHWPYLFLVWVYLDYPLLVPSNLPKKLAFVKYLALL